jgi:archaellum biogenesis ATPase FlaH
MYEQDQWQTEGENREKLQVMKEQAIKDNDVIVFNSINSYERSGKDVTVLLKIIKQLYDENRKLKNE